ncbi:MAG: hypothetical protein ACYC5O_00655, partial [Anaerolineae bacterium]
SRGEERRQHLVGLIEESMFAVIEARTAQLRHCSSPEWLDRQRPEALVEWNQDQYAWLGNLLKLLLLAPHGTAVGAFFATLQAPGGCAQVGRLVDGLACRDCPRRGTCAVWQEAQPPEVQASEPEQLSSQPEADDGD